MKIMSYHKKIQYYKWNKKDTKILFHSIQELINIKSLQFYMPFYSLYFYIHNKPQSNLKIDLQRNFYIRNHIRQNIILVQLTFPRFYKKLGYI